MSTWTPEQLESLYRHHAERYGECICPPGGPCYSPTADKYTPCYLCQMWPLVAACPNSQDGVHPAVSP
jgi:hypothetical protein